VLGHGAGVIARLVILLVGAVMLLVQNDEAQIAGRGEEGGARPDHDLVPAFGQRLPGRVPLGIRQGGVEDRHPAGEAGDEPAHDLGRQRDLRHQHDRRPAMAQTPGDRPQVDLGFAAAGDAVQQEGARVAGR